MPVAQWTRSQKSVVVQFWKRKELFTLGNEERPTLYFNGRKVVKKSEVSGVDAKTFKEVKSPGHKKLKQRSHNSYTGLTEQKIQVTSTNIEYCVHNAAFTNLYQSQLEHTMYSGNTRSIWLP